MAWWDFYKFFTYAFEDDPKSKLDKSQENPIGAGYGGPEVTPYMGRDMNDIFPGQATPGKLRVGNDFVDYSIVQNRTMRYKEYERLRSIPEIEQVITVIADEACIAGDTKINTLSEGMKTIKWLTENKKNEEFFVYCWDFEKNDYALGLAYNPRVVKTAKTVKVILDDGTFFVATHDHRVLLDNNEWIAAGNIKRGEKLKPFYRVPANQNLTKVKVKQFPRIYTNKNGWVHERQFIDEWKCGKSLDIYNKVNKYARMIDSGIKLSRIAEVTDNFHGTIEAHLKGEGFSYAELKWLAKKSKHRTVVAVIDWKEMEVYDLSVKDHENFCGESVIFHNCQENKNGDVLEITCKNSEIREEVKFLFLHREMLNLNENLWKITKRTCINGDWFGEIIIQPQRPDLGVLRLEERPPDSMYRMETDKGKLLEFQQSGTGPDYQALLKSPVEEATESELLQGSAIRFTPKQIIHIRLGEDRKTFYPYGQSLIEPARGPAHQLRLMEDSMVVYRLTRAPERRVFYIDVGTMHPSRAESLMSRVQDLLRKKKVVARPGDGAASVEEKFVPPSPEEDIWIPIRTDSKTRVETLPGAQNLGEIDDTVYFRNKLYNALNFPPSYLNSEDSQYTRITVSSQVARFSRMIERIQKTIANGLWEVADRHLKLLGFPKEAYRDLTIKITNSSDWRYLSRMEIENNKINNATTLKGSMLFSDFDILTKIMDVPEEEVTEMISRMKLQKMEEARLQILVQNPVLLGIGVPGEGEEQMGVDSEGPSPTPNPEEPSNNNPEGQPSAGGEPEEPQNKGHKFQNTTNLLPEPDESDLKRFDLEIQSYGQEQDFEES